MTPLCKRLDDESTHTDVQPSGLGKSITGASLSADNPQGKFKDVSLKVKLCGTDLKVYYYSNYPFL